MIISIEKNPNPKKILDKREDRRDRAGVSKTAVSFAFNNPSRLSEARVKNILAIAEELGYIPNPVARSMNTGRTGTIGVLVPQPIPEIIRNPFLPEFLEGVGEVYIRVNLSLMIVPPVEGSMLARCAIAFKVTGQL